MKVNLILPEPIWFYVSIFITKGFYRGLCLYAGLLKTQHRHISSVRENGDDHRQHLLFVA
jgi:hypothetical protein